MLAFAVLVAAIILWVISSVAYGIGWVLSVTAFGIGTVLSAIGWLLFVLWILLVALGLFWYLRGRGKGKITEGITSTLDEL